MEERMLKWFEYEHLAATHSAIPGAPFAALARHIVEHLPPGPERTVSLRKLLESMDAAIRAGRIPGG